jgi:hypothetical protein
MGYQIACHVSNLRTSKNSMILKEKKHGKKGLPVGVTGLVREV